MTPIRRGRWARLLLIKAQLVPRQIEIDVKVTEDIRAEQTIERCREDSCQRDRSHQNATPWDRNPSGSEAAQLDLMSCEVAGNPMHPPLKFDRWPLRPNPLGDSRGQDRPLRAGIQNQRYRVSIGGEGHNRHAVQCCDDDLSDPLCATTGCTRNGKCVRGARCCESKGRRRSIGVTGGCRESGQNRPNKQDQDLSADGNPQPAYLTTSYSVEPGGRECRQQFDQECACRIDHTIA